MGLLSSWTVREAAASTTGSKAPSSTTQCGQVPKDDAELRELVAAARAHLGDAAAETDRLLRVGGEEPLTDGQVKRWLAARGWDPARAAHDLKAHAVWRSNFIPAGRVREAEIAKELAQSKVLVQGLDRQGRAIVVLVGGNHLPNPDQTEVQKFFCYCADAGIAMADTTRNPTRRIVFVLDVGDFGWKNFDLAGAKSLFHMIHAHYVERLSVLYFHNASTVVQQLYRLVSPFVDPATRKKVVFLPHDPAKAKAILEAEMDVQLLPPSLGGSSAPRSVQDAWAAVDAAAGAAPSAAPELALSAPSEPAAAAGEDVFVDIARQEAAADELAAGKGALAAAAPPLPVLA